MAKNLFLTLENRYKVCREYSDLWQQFFQFFSEDLENLQITREMETEFSNLMNILALNHYKFSELCGEFMKDPNDVVKILCESVSLRNIQEMSEAARNKLILNWHTTFMEMNKALGKILGKMSPKQLEALQIPQANLPPPPSQEEVGKAQG